MKLYIDSFKDRKFGSVFFAVSDRGLRYLTFGKNSGIAEILKHAEKYHLETGKNSRTTQAIKRQLKEYFRGKRATFRAKLDIDYLPSFRQRALRQTKKIPYGKIATYGQIAHKTGSPGAARAVGQAMAANPIPIVIPCHRVIGSNGDLTGFGGGIAVKKRLLEMEGIVTKGKRVVIE